MAGQPVEHPQYVLIDCKDPEVRARLDAVMQRVNGEPDADNFLRASAVLDVFIAILDQIIDPDPRGFDPYRAWRMIVPASEIHLLVLPWILMSSIDRADNPKSAALDTMDALISVSLRK